MGKSSSNRKKRSKKSSQGRTKKGKSSSRKYGKSKKLHRRDDSRTYSSDDDSRSSMSVSCSSSEDDYRSMRARSRSRRDVNGKKKRVRRRSPRSESRKEGKKRARRHSKSSKSREEAKKRSRRRSYSLEGRGESPHSRKRILLKRTNGSEVERKTRKKNKARREASVSSMSSGSYSSHESEFERRRGRSERKEKGKNKLEKVESGNREERYRSRSYSSCSASSEAIKCWSEEINTCQNNVKRLRSVITVVKEEKEDGFSNRDETKEEIIYDNDDYPSCRSNDSNDGRHKRELDYQSSIITDKKMRVENDKGEEVVSNIKATGLTENVEGQYMGNNPSSSSVGPNDSVEGKVTGVTRSLSGDDLESILRQRALENLRRFRGRPQTSADVPVNKKDTSDGGMKQPTTVQAELVQIKIPREDDAKLPDVTQELTENPALRRNSNCCLQDDEKTLDDGQQSGTAKQQLACATDQVASADKQDENVSSAAGSVVNRPKLAKPTLEHYSIKNHNPQEETRTSDELHQANLLMTESALVECAAKTSQTMAPSSSYKEDVKVACGSASHESSSCMESKLVENASNKTQGETADSGQFEKKTMTVMRGGEMVQVSYKVYIPKKAPALARRQLKR